MKYASMSILFLVLATVAIVKAARPNKHQPKVSGSSDLPSKEGLNQMMEDPMGGGSMQDPDAARGMDSSMGGGYAKRNKGRGRKRARVMESSTSSPVYTPNTSTSTTHMPSTPEYTDPPKNESNHHNENKGSDDMMSMTTTTPVPKMQSTTTAKGEMNMFPDLDTVEQLQKKQAEEHEKIIAVYKSFKDWVDYLRNSIKGGTLNPVLTRRILEDIRAYQQVIMSPHPHKPYNPPHPCDPVRDVWCPEQSAAMIAHTMYKEPIRNRYDDGIQVLF